MSDNKDRYAAKVLKVVDPFTVIANLGREHGVETDDEFLIVGVGEDIVDPDTNEVLERLELVRGTARVTHVQSRICTLESTAVEQLPDTKEVRRNPTSRAAGQYSVVSAFLARAQETATEVVTSGGFKPLPFKQVAVGDCLIKQ